MSTNGTTVIAACKRLQRLVSIGLSPISGTDFLRYAGLRTDRRQYRSKRGPYILPEETKKEPTSLMDKMTINKEVTLASEKINYIILMRNPKKDKL